MFDEIASLEQLLNTERRSFRYSELDGYLTNLIFHSESFGVNGVPENIFEILSAFEYLEEIELNCDCTVIKSLLGINTLSRLTKLSITGPSNISDITPLNGLVSLKSISIPYALIEDVTPLFNLWELEELNLEGNRIREVFPAHAFTNLHILNVDNNPFKEQLSGEVITTWNSEPLSVNKLKEAITLHYFEQKNYDEALGNYYPEVIDEMVINIRYHKLLNCDKEDAFILRYHLTKCLSALWLYKQHNNNQNNAFSSTLFKQMTEFAKETEMEFKDDFVNYTYFNTLPRRFAIQNMIDNSKAANYPDLIYDKAISLLNETYVSKALYLYKMLYKKAHPLQYALYSHLKHFIKHNLPHDPELLQQKETYKHVLLNITTAPIPEFAETEIQRLAYNKKIMKQSIVNEAHLPKEKEISPGFIFSLTRIIAKIFG